MVNSQTISTEQLLSRYSQGDRGFSNLRFYKIRAAAQTLSGCDFSNSHFDDCVFGGANMQDCNFDGVKIERTNAIDVRLTRSKFTNARIAGAFGGADFFEADLSGATVWANLHDSFLLSANFSSTRFMTTVFKGAYLGNNIYNKTLFFMCDLSEIHLMFPSRIDMGTVHATAQHNQRALQVAQEGQVALDGNDLRRAQELAALGTTTTREFFLANHINQSDVIGIYIHDSISGSSMYQSVFISYASADEEFAQTLHYSLRAQGVNVWFAPHDMRSGRTIITQVTRAIRKAERLVLVLSEASMKSNWVAAEILEARHAEKEQGVNKLFPVRIVDVEKIHRWQLFDSDTGEDLARIVREYHILDFSTWRNTVHKAESVARLMRDLKRS
jgi:uncharacterized protein YjbI with pentapeptide repeats